MLGRQLFPPLHAQNPDFVTATWKKQPRTRKGRSEGDHSELLCDYKLPLWASFSTSDKDVGGCRLCLPQRLLSRM